MVRLKIPYSQRKRYQQACAKFSAAIIMWNFSTNLNHFYFMLYFCCSWGHLKIWSTCLNSRCVLCINYILRMSTLGFHWRSLGNSEDLQMKQALPVTLPQIKTWTIVTMLCSERWPLHFIRNKINMPKWIFRACGFLASLECTTPPSASQLIISFLRAVPRSVAKYII